MATMPAAYLKIGERSLNLNDRARYYLQEGFTPPAARIVPVLARGTSANRYGGSIRVGERAEDREFSFAVDVITSSDAEMRRAVNDIRGFLDDAGDTAEPLYFTFLPNSDTPEPLWGNYGVPLRYEVLYGTLELPGDYLVGLKFASILTVTITLTVKPFAGGISQRVASALGGILEDIIGTVDGSSRGLIIPEATTNKMTNPVFGHSTWNNGWTAGSDLISSQNTDKEYFLFGTSSAKVTRKGSVDAVFRQSINVGNTNTHILRCYAKRVDGAPVTSSDVQLYYNAALSTAYASVGNGWYSLTASVTGINAATNTGILMAAIGRSIYVDGFQIEEKTLATPLAYGDLLGCAWTGTAHASTSTRTAGQCRIAAGDILNVSQGTIRAIVNLKHASGTQPTMYIFNQDTITNFHGRILSTGVIDFFDNTNQIVSAAQTWAANDILVLHFVYGPGSMKIYKDGLEIATGSTYTPPVYGTYLYIGSFANASTTRSSTTFMDFTTFDVALTVAQVQADYNNIAAVVADDQRVGSVPWLWTKDGDDIVDNADDSSRDNWCAVGGVPGSVRAKTDYVLTATTHAGYYLVNTPLPYGDMKNSAAFTNLYYVELQGTADANASGGEYNQIVANGQYPPASDPRPVPFPYLLDGPIHFFIRLKQASASTLSLKARIQYQSGGSSIDGASRTVSTTTGYKTFYLGDLNFSFPPTLPNSLKAAFLLVEVTGVSANVHGDYLMALPGDIIKLLYPGGSTATIYLSEAQSIALDTSLNLHTIGLSGRRLNLYPDMVNRITSHLGNDAEASALISDTLTYTRIDVTPRYALL